MTLDSLIRDDTTVVVIAPHPDDESLAAGGLLQTALARGARVAVVLLTNGDNNAWPQRLLERRCRIDESDRVRWGERRRAEVERALAVLGVDIAALYCLSWHDMGLTSRILRYGHESTEMLGALLAQLMPSDRSPDLLVFPSLHDGHPDHSAAHVLVELALSDADIHPNRMCYTVHGAASAAAVELTLNESLRRGKMAAVEEHYTQLALSRGRMLRYAGHPERFAIEPEQPCTRLHARYALSWSVRSVQARCCVLLVATPAGAWRLPLTRPTSPKVRTADSPRLVRDGSELTLELPPSLCTSGPLFVKLTGRTRSPWIYDRWGWARLDAG